MRVLDDLVDRSPENIDEIGGKVDFIEGSVADEKLLGKVLDGVELVFHEAAIPSVPRSVKAPRESHIASVEGTFSLLLAAKEKKVQTCNLCSVEFCLRRSTDAAKSEKMAPDPLSPYAVGETGW